MKGGGFHVARIRCLEWTFNLPHKEMPMWDRAGLHNLIEAKMAGYRFIVVANREPFIH